MRKAAWVIPFPTEGSGGHRTIFQNIQALVDNGYECHAYIEDIGAGYSADQMKNIIENYFGKINARFFCGYELKEEYDIVFATAWFTAKHVRDINQSCKKAYFVQDFEAYFNPMGDGYLLAENSYRYGLTPITIGRWLTNKMITEYNEKSNYFDFCADNKVYRRLDHIEKEKAICFIYQPEKPRRCSIIGIEALGIVKHLMPDVKIYLYGSKNKSNVWFEHENLELLNIEKCNELYNRCMVGLCISSSNPSRIPFEMMAAGLPVVDIYKENNLYDMPDGGVVLADQTPESIAKAIISILNDPIKQTEMSNFGIEFMKEKTLEHGYNQFVSAVNNLFDENGDNQSAKVIEKMYNSPPVIADVYIHQTSSKLRQTHSYDLNDKGRVYNFLRKIKRRMKRLLNIQ